MSDSGLIQRLMTRISGGFILAFHEIPPDRLTQLVESLRPAQAVPLAEMVERSKARRSTSGLFAITVDDGVGHNVKALTRVFREKQWPATFYLSTQYLDTGERMLFQWWQQLVPLLPRRRLELSSGILDLAPAGAIEDLSHKMERFWHSRKIEYYLPLIKELIDLVVRERCIDKEALRPPPPISWEEVTEISRDDLISFESHAVSHTALSALTEEELVYELSYSQTRVAEHTGRPCRHIAYPFGNPRSIGSLTAPIARRFYDSGTTMTLGHVDGADPWLMPRIPLYPSNSTAYARLKILLKCTELSLGRGAIQPWAPETAPLLASKTPPPEHGSKTSTL